MNRIFSGSRFGLARLAFATLLAALPLADLPAQEKLAPGSGPAADGVGVQPALVVTLGSISKLQQDVSYISAVAGQPQAGGMFAGMSAMFTQGIDPSQPIGIMVSMVDGAPKLVAMVPTNDVKTFLKRLEAQTGPADELSDGTLALVVGPQTIFVKQAGDWAVVSNERESLAMAPAQPDFSGMGNDYDIAVRLKVQQIPASAREMLTGQLRQGFERAMSQQGEASDEGREYAENSIQQLERFIDETDELFFGINVNPTAKHVSIETSFSALEGTSMAAMYAGQQPIPSRFASVIRPNAAAFIHAACSISPGAVSQAEGSVTGSISMLKNVLKQQGDLPADQQDAISELIDRVSKIAMDSIAEGKSDAGALLLADDGGLQFVFGSFVADGNEVASLAKDIAAEAQGKPRAPRFSFDRATYKGVAMHLIEADVPEQEDEARKVFGPTLKVHIGTADKAVYVALGDASQPALKELIDAAESDAGGSRPISQGQVKMLPILRYIQSIETNEVVDSMIAALTQAQDAGEVTFVADAIANGQETSITIGEGVLQAVGAGVKAGQKRQAGGGF